MRILNTVLLTIILMILLVIGSEVHYIKTIYDGTNPDFEDITTNE